MPEIQVRSVLPADLPILVDIDHGYITDRVWQMALLPEQTRVQVSFREIKLPRSVQVEYPREPVKIADEWNQRTGFLVALYGTDPVGYFALQDGGFKDAVYGTDLAVARRFRRQGVARVLLLAGQEWAREKNYHQLILEMQSKNYPAICLAQQAGYEFCGYNDRYYPNKDIALFFARSLG